MTVATHHNKIKRTTLDGIIKIVDWLRANRDAILKQRPQRNALATQAEIALGFDVSVSAITQACTSIGLEYSPVRKNATGKAWAGKTARAILIETIRVTLIALLHEFGKTVPEALKHTESDLRMTGIRRALESVNNSPNGVAS